MAGFEVDHPATIALKISRLRTLLGELPPNVRFVEIDFERQKLPDRLQAEGFDSRQQAIFIWEGVTNYLTAGAVDGVLQNVGRLCASPSGADDSKRFTVKPNMHCPESNTSGGNWIHQ